jgi:beta-glucosidase
MNLLLIMTASTAVDSCATTWPGINCNGHSIVAQPPLVTSSQACCDFCAKTAGCTAWTWNGLDGGGGGGGNRQCYAKLNCTTPTSSGEGVTSGGAVPLPPPAPTPAPVPVPWPSTPWFDVSLPPATRAAALVAALTLPEKAAQMVVDAPAVSRVGLPSYHWRSNVLHGLVDNGASTMFPQATGLAATWDATALQGAARIMSVEQRAKNNQNRAQRGNNGSDMNYGLNLWGPNINIFRDPRWGRGQETYGECPFLTGAMGIAMVRGLQEGSQANVTAIAATIKHFIAYDVDEEPPRLSFDPNISAADLAQTYQPAFEDCVVRGKAEAVMCAYSGVNGYPSCVSPLLESTLRGEMGFGGYVVSDSGAIDFLVSEYHRYPNKSAASVAAVSAGVDLNSGGCFSTLSASVQAGAVQESVLDVALTRLFTSRIKLGCFDPPATVSYTQIPPSAIATTASKAVALDVAERSLVLLKNDAPAGADGGAPPLLPLMLSAAKPLRLGVVGPNANDTFTLVGNYYGCSIGTWGPLLPKYCNITTPLEGIRTLVGFGQVENVQWAKGCEQESSTNQSDLIAAAVQLAAEVDVVVAVLGLRNCQGGQGKGGRQCESEGNDRNNLGLPGAQETLLAALLDANPRVALVLQNGGPVSLSADAARRVPAIVESWYGGEAAGAALTNMLTGAVSPAGRMPFTVPTNLSQVPPELHMPMDEAPGRTYRYLTQPPLYAFGYGLSYTTFAYSGLTVTQPAAGAVAAGNASLGGTLTLSATVQNTGSVHTSDEVVQVYATLRRTPPMLARVASCPEMSVPLRQLVGFVRLRELTPGSRTSVSVACPVRALRLLDCGYRYQIVAGTYDLSLGGHAPGSRGQYIDGDGDDDASLLHTTLIVKE